jgi:hypothetical protein
MSTANIQNKQNRLKISILLLIFISIHTGVFAQGPRFFHYHEIAGHLKELRKGALEYVAISGNNTPEGDQRMLDTLRMFLGKNLPPGVQPLWSDYHGVIKNLQIKGANWRQLPEELTGFRHLFELSFIQCPYINLQSINDQMKARRDADRADHMYRKFKNDIVSLSFSNTNFETQDSCHLEKELLEELKELRFVRIGNFSRHCENLLTELGKAYPALGWLTIEDCGLDDMNSLLPLQAFKKLKSVTLARNRLTQMPKVPESLNALDMSFNFLSEFPDKDSISLKKLDFLYLDCNLFDYLNLYKVLSDTLLDRMDVFTYDPCNFDNPQDLRLIAPALDKRKVAVYMPFVPRYHNDFAVALPDCNRCSAHRSAVVDDLLKEVTFVDSSGTGSHISFVQDRMKWETLTAFGPENRIFFYRQLKSCTRDFKDPDDPAQVWDWQLCFWLVDTGSIDGGVKKLELRIKGKTGKAFLEVVEN